MEDFLKEVRYSVVSLIEKFLTTASQQLDNFLKTSWLLHDNYLAIALQKRQRIMLCQILKLPYCVNKNDEMIFIQRVFSTFLWDFISLFISYTTVRPKEKKT